MIDFPASPTVGQIFTSAGVSWKWDGTKWVANTTAAGGGSTNDVGRNLIHNPMFNIAQRGAGAFTSGYGLDRWTVNALVAGTASVTQDLVTDAGRAAIGDEAATYNLMNVFTGSATASARTMGSHYLEGVRRLAGKTVTLSFYAIGSAALKLGASLDQYFGTGGSPSAGVNGTGQSVTLTTAWARYSLTFTLPSIAGMTVGTNRDDFTSLTFWYSAEATNNVRSGSVGVQSGTIRIWGVQLEIGSVATPLEKPDPQQDLAKCQRFYQRGSVFQAFYHTAASGCAMTVFLPVQMRAAQTINILTNSDGNLTSPTAGSLSGSSIYFLANAVATGGVTFSRTFELSTDL